MDNLKSSVLSNGECMCVIVCLCVLPNVCVMVNVYVMVCV